MRDRARLLRVLIAAAAAIVLLLGAATVSTERAAAQSSVEAPVAPGEAPAGDGAGEDGVQGTSSDLLTSNGLRSPWCTRPATAVARRNCQTGGLTSSGAAGDNTSFDVHIDTSEWTGAPKITEWFLSVMLSLLGFVWTVMVMITRGAFVALEFAFGFNPLDTRHAGSLGHDLNRQLTTITRPLALILAPVGGVWLLWTALANRRHGHALKQTVLSALLTVAVTVVLSNPIGTIGSLLTSSQQVGLAVISLASGGSPGDGSRQAQAGLRSMADGVIDQPLALLEFGSASFGADPGQMAPELRDAAAKLAREESPARQEAVRAAKTNLDLFQIWPANSKQRNAINDEGSLLRVLCQSDDDTGCKGKYAKYAEFRTEQGAWQRMVGLVLILLGLIPVWIVLLYCATKIIGAGILTVIRLIQLSFIAPLAAAGEAGNQRVIKLGGDLLGGILTAAAYSFFLGLVMTMWRLVSTWSGYGWVMQWLLLILTLWLLIMQREKLFGAASAPGSASMGVGGFMARQMAFRAGLKTTTVGARAGRRAMGAGIGAGRTAGRLGARAATAPVKGAARSVRGQAGHAKGAVGGALGRPGSPRDGAPGPDADGPAQRQGERESGSAAATAGAQAALAGAQAAAAGAQAAAGAGQAWRRGNAGGGSGEGRPSERAVLGARRSIAAQNKRVAAVSAHVRQQRAGSRDEHVGRQARLATHLDEVGAALPGTRGAERKQLLKRRERLAYRHEQARRSAGAAKKAEQAMADAKQNPGRDRAIRSSTLDRQAALPRGVNAKGRRRDYAQLASLLGASPQAYRAAQPGERLRMRADVDRELERRVGHRSVLNAERAHQRQERARAPTASAAASAGSGRGAASPTVKAKVAAAGGQGAPSRPGRPARRESSGRRDAFRQAARRRDA